VDAGNEDLHPSVGRVDQRKRTAHSSFRSAWTRNREILFAVYKKGRKDDLTEKEKAELEKTVQGAREGLAAIKGDISAVRVTIIPRIDVGGIGRCLKTTQGRVFLRFRLVS
jgi:hypothetical protein